MVTGIDIVKYALKWDGHDYIYGGKTDQESDCSGLVYLTCKELGVNPAMPDGSWDQYEFCRDHGTLIDISDALRIPGTLGFIQSGDEHHVVVFQGKRDSDGYWLTMQCKGRDYG